MTTMGAGHSRHDERDPLLRKAKGPLGPAPVSTTGGEVKHSEAGVEMLRNDDDDDDDGDGDDEHPEIQAGNQCSI